MLPCRLLFSFLQNQSFFFLRSHQPSQTDPTTLLGRFRTPTNALVNSESKVSRQHRKQRSSQSSYCLPYWPPKVLFFANSPANLCPGLDLILPIPLSHLPCLCLLLQSHYRLRARTYSAAQQFHLISFSSQTIHLPTHIKKIRQRGSQEPWVALSAGVGPC